MYCIWEELKSLERKKKSMNETIQNECVIIGDILNKNEAILSPDITEKKKISGIYKIVNKVNGKYYVGSSTNISDTSHGRWKRHKYLLNKNSHFNIHLQRAWNKYGKNNFIFSFIEETLSKYTLKLEQKYLDIAKNEQDKCYNQNFISGIPPLWTEEDRRKWSQLFSGKGNPMYGKHHTEDTKLSMRIKKLGKFHTKEHNRKISNSLMGHKRSCGIIHSEETLMKRSKSFSGSGNGNFDPTIYKFKNVLTEEIFEGTRYDFIHEFYLNSGSVCMVIHKQRKIVGNWQLIL